MAGRSPRPSRSRTPRRSRRSTETIRVTVLPLGGEVKEVVVKSGAAVEDVLEAAGITSGNAEVRINGQVVDFDDVVENGETLTVLNAGKIEHGFS